MHADHVNYPRTPLEPASTDAAEVGALQEIVQLAAGAATWDELMQLIVDRSTVAMDAEVCSLYLVDRDGAGLTLAATNGVDREHIGVARLDIGQGITGLAASTRGPVVSTDLANVRAARGFAASTTSASRRSWPCRSRLAIASSAS